MLTAKYICTLSLFLGISIAQEAPFYTTEMYHPTERHRQNVCDRHDMYYNGDVELRDALQGLELHPIVAVSNLFHLDEEGKIDEEDPGIVAVLLDELGRRCGFTWRNTFGIYYGPGEGNSYTDLLIWASEAYDVSVDWYFNSLDRLRAGIGFPRGFYDGSYILVGKKDEVQEETVDLFNWLEPFEDQLWWAILGTTLISAVVYMVLENLNRRREKRDWSLSRNVFYSFLLGAQHNQFNPKSPPARLFAVSLAFWSLIIVATYTANLASFFVVQNTPGLQVNSIDDVVLARLPICVVDGWASTEYVEQNYPRGVFVYKNSEVEQFHGVINGDCHYALSSVGSWNIYENDMEANGGCELTWIGRVVRFVDAGMGIKSDAGVLCTSLIQDVMNVHLVEMVADGFIEQAWEDFYKQNMDIDCAAISSDNIVIDSPELSLYEMGGTFFVHCMGAVLAFLITAGNKFWVWYKAKQRLRNKEVVEYVEAEDESSLHNADNNNNNTTTNNRGSGSGSGGLLEAARKSFKVSQITLRTDENEFTEHRLDEATSSSDLQEQLRVLRMDQQELQGKMFKEQSDQKQQITSIIAMLQDTFQEF